MNRVGCLALVILTVLSMVKPALLRAQCTTPSDTVVATILTCQPYTWAVNGSTYSNSVSKKVFTSDCVLNILNLTMHESLDESRRIFSCGDYFWSKTDQTYNISGTYIYQENTEDGYTVEHQLI